MRDIKRSITLVDAAYINRSGGMVLLEYLIKFICERTSSGNSFFYLLDERLTDTVFKGLHSSRFVQITGNEKSRKSFYKKNILKFDAVLCFGNVPPPIEVKGAPVFIYFHNALFLGKNTSNYGFITRLGFWAKRKYIGIKNRPSYNWLVQTEGVKKGLIETLNINKDRIELCPFFDTETIVTESSFNKKQSNNRFLYVAEGVPQKNHILLLDAWEFLYNKYGLKLELHLTIDSKNIQIIDKIKHLQGQGVQIINHGFCTTSKVLELYRNCFFFIFPSLSESFGLPLVEAASAGCQVIASDLPFVFEIIKPLAVFDPNKSASIASVVADIVLQPSSGQSTEILIKDRIADLHKLILS